MKSKNVAFGLLLALLLGVAVSCAPSRKAYRTNNLLVKSNVFVYDADSVDVVPNLSSFVVPIPNTKFLGLFRLNLFTYEIGNMLRKDSKFKNFLQKSWGEAPVYADTAFFYKTISQFNQELFNQGFFNPEISFKTFVNNKNNAKVYYLVRLNEPYTYNVVDNYLPDTVISDLVFGGESETLIKPGDILNSYTLDDERSRITEILRNNGYYLFSKDLIEYVVDTNLLNKKANIAIKINKPIIQEKGVNKSIDLKKYYIRNVHVYSNFDSHINYRRTYENDIRVSQHIPEGDTATNGLFYIYEIGKQKLRADVLLNSIYIKPGGEYQHNAVNWSSKSLTNIPSVRYAAISFDPVGSYNDSLLDCSVRITRKKLHAFSISPEVTNNGGRLGFGASTNYNNRNIFKGGESLQLTASGSFELQFGSTETQVGNLLHTAQAGITTTLFFPRILLPFGWGNMPGYNLPRTNIDLGFSYQKRADLYDRIISNVAMGYSWRSNNSKLSHYFSPIDFNYVSIDKEPILENYISQMKGSLYERQYTSHTLLGMRYSLVVSNQSDKKKKGVHHYFRVNAEASGNFLNLMSTTFNQERDSLGLYNFLGSPYSQFVMGDLEYRLYHYFTPDNVIVFRFATGIGFPYGNSVALPVEKAFYGGGANDMRGWGLKLLGPGSYQSDLLIERVADVAIKANVEYRFPIYKFIRLAAFLDVGNVWLWNADPDFQGGEFNFKRFYKEFAVNTGLGLRLDFNFFVLRLDVGIPFVDPSLPENDRFMKLKMSNAVWNIAIGYPF